MKPPKRKLPPPALKVTGAAAAASSAAPTTPEQNYKRSLEAPPEQIRPRGRTDNPLGLSMPGPVGMFTRAPMARRMVEKIRSGEDKSDTTGVHKPAWEQLTRVSGSNPRGLQFRPGVPKMGDVMDDQFRGKRKKKLGRGGPTVQDLLDAGAFRGMRRHSAE